MGQVAPAKGMAFGQTGGGGYMREAPKGGGGMVFVIIYNYLCWRKNIRFSLFLCKLARHCILSYSAGFCENLSDFVEFRKKRHFLKDGAWVKLNSI